MGTCGRTLCWREFAVPPAGRERRATGAGRPGAVRGRHPDSGSRATGPAGAHACEAVQGPHRYGDDPRGVRRELCELTGATAADVADVIAASAGNRDRYLA